MLCSPLVDVAAAQPASGPCQYAPWSSWHRPPTAAELRQLQCELSYALSDYHGPITGVFDQRTLAALLRFQTCDGLAADGIYGPRTQAELYRVYLSGQPVC
ncbi:peptidoglycan-binding domain-containing protein [Streptomyces sp. NPDC051993]|uniref:peptidoglycan-binding domain-containing protein n=1 Tax=Streptomyces sp. NPDC051993 TaxID=3155286 RepID=UPI00342FFCDD